MSTCTGEDFGPSPLDAVDSTFQALVSGPRPLAVDGARIGHGLPRRLVPLDELRVMLLHPSMSYAARNAAWRELVDLARGYDPAWIVGAAGVALPALRERAGRLAAYNAGRRLRRREAAHAGRRAELAESVRPPRPSGHPDFVLARAVAAGVITRSAADLIGRTRLEDVPLSQAAAEAGLSYTAALNRRWRGERRLARAIADGELEEP